MESDSEDNECSCYDVTPRDGTWVYSSDAFLADDKITI
jgi:hypothetical protein